MNIHYFQHVPYEGLGIIEHWANKPGNKITATKFYEDHRFPFIDLFDMLIVMGGPMGANDDRKYPWMASEKKLIEHAIKKDKHVLGICLGAQLIADVLGAKVYPNKDKEIGWFPVESTLQGQAGYFSHAESSMDVFHWHGDTFDLPAGTTHLAKSKGCTHQAFSYGDNVLALQFHLEASKETVRQFLAAGKDELVQGKYIQSYQDILNADDRKYQFTNSVLLKILDQIGSKKIAV